MATIGVRGPGAAQIVGKRFRPASGKPFRSFAPGSAVFGRFDTSAPSSEELVVGLITDAEVEIHCHGGSAAAEAIQAALVEEGCTPVEPFEWAAESESDPIAASALLALAQARTERTVAVLLDQYRGALCRELCQIKHDLEKGEIAAASGGVRQLLDRAEFGLHLTQPWQVVLAGRPNAGKSSLMNALVGYERAIVYPQPGTTRDVLTATTALDGWPVELADTAGLREPGDALEAEGVSRAKAEVRRADLVVFVADTTAPWDELFFRDVGEAARRLVVVHNKCDLARPAADLPSGAVVRAKTGEGIDGLCHAIADRLVPNAPPPGIGVPFTPEQRARLGEVERSISKEDWDEAQRLLLRLLVQ